MSSTAEWKSRQKERFSSEGQCKKTLLTWSRRSVVLKLVFVRMTMMVQALSVGLLITLLCSCQGQGQGQDGGASRGFLVKVTGCTGSLIAPNWVLTAAHCIVAERYNSVRNSHGDLELDLTQGYPSNPVMKPLYLNVSSTSQLWTRPVTNLSVSTNPNFHHDWHWRMAEKMIIHGSFREFANIWRGRDLLLVKLAPEVNPNPAHAVPGSYAVPICLPDAGFDDTSPQDTFMAGWGRRNLPHCMTNHLGPEPYETCGRPIRCSHDHFTNECGLNFLYQGQYHTNGCLHSDTPSALDPECILLRQAIPSLENSTRVTNVFGLENQLITKCYPRQAPPGTTNGWCTTRPPNTDVNTEPTPTSGWGFCSAHQAFSRCNGNVGWHLGRDPTPLKVQVLNDRFCSEKLGKNLNKEQPSVGSHEYARPREDLKLLCIGMNRTFEEDQQYYRKLSDSSYQLLSASEAGVSSPEYHVEGGPSCFGDSGGPLYKMVPHPGRPSGTRPRLPVLTGVFSTILWGTCRGRDEPGYYARVSSYMDWIQRYVTRRELCLVGPTRVKPAWP